jgi:hypothetical protein
MAQEISRGTRAEVECCQDQLRGPDKLLRDCNLQQYIPIARLLMGLSTYLVKLFRF